MDGSNPNSADRASPVIEDVEILTPRKRWFRRNSKWLLIIAISFVAGAVCLVERSYLAPQRDEKIVAEALQLVAAEPNNKKWYAKLIKMSLADQQ